jgi:hypothetical protein
MIVFANQALPLVAGSYVLTGRFNPEKEFEKHSATNLSPETATSVPRLQTVAVQNQRTQIVGTSAEWENYHKAFDTEIQDSRDSPEVRDSSHFFKFLNEKGTAAIDANGAIWMQLSENSESTFVGVSASNVLAPESNPQLSYELLLARTSTFLKSPKHRRETMLEFHQDWSNLQRASASATATALSAGTNAPPKLPHVTPIPGGGTL